MCYSLVSFYHFGIAKTQECLIDNQWLLLPCWLLLVVTLVDNQWLLLHDPQSHFSLPDRHADLQKQYKEAAHTVKEQKELITQLETDLLSVNALPSTHRGQGEVWTLTNWQGFHSQQPGEEFLVNVEKYSFCFRGLVSCEWKSYQLVNSRPRPMLNRVFQDCMQKIKLKGLESWNPTRDNKVPAVSS